MRWVRWASGSAAKVVRGGSEYPCGGYGERVLVKILICGEQKGLRFHRSTDDVNRNALCFDPLWDAPDHFPLFTLAKPRGCRCLQACTQSRIGHAEATEGTPERGQRG